MCVFCGDRHPVVKIHPPLTEKYFEMNKKQCKDALDFYKRFLVRMDRVAEFLKVAENVGIDKGDIPDLTRVCTACFLFTMINNVQVILCIYFLSHSFDRHRAAYLKR